MELRDIFADPSLIQAVATIAAILVMAAISAIAVYIGVERLHRVWLIVRGQWPTVIAAVDESTDPALVGLDKWLDKLMPAEWNKVAAQFLPVFLRTLADHLDDLLGVPDKPETAATPPRDAVR